MNCSRTDTADRQEIQLAHAVS